MTWICPYCSYENSDDANFCIRCGAKKPEGVNSQPVQQEQLQQPQTSVQQQTAEPQALPSAGPNSLSEPQAEPASSSSSEQQNVTPQSMPEQQPLQPTEIQQSQLASSQQVTPPTAKYYILFIATPASALNKSKVPLDFDVFDHISIGRSPENVIVVPDPEVSRRHAMLSLENGKLYIEDLNSTNGTYIYDGKIFNPVKGKLEIQSGSLVKLGNSTIIKIVTE